MSDPLVKKIIATEERPIEQVLSEPGKIYTFLNPVSYLPAIKQEALFESFDGIFADGSLLVGAIAVLYGRKVTRRSFDMTSMAPLLLDYAAKNGKSVYIVASHQQEVEEVGRKWQQDFPQLRIAGVRNGYFRSKAEREEFAQQVADANPDFLIVGMGISTQEKFLRSALRKGFRGIGFTCGGFIHQTAGAESDTEQYYPGWINSLNLRFLYRIYKEKHTRRRYLAAALKFPPIFTRRRFFK